MRNLGFLAFGFSLLLAQAVLAAHVSLHPLTPSLLLPIVIFLGVQHDVTLLRGALLSFLLGYMLDEFCGSPMGLQTFIMVATFMAARGAGIRLFMRGVAFQMGLVFVASLLTGGTILALRGIFSPTDPFPLEMPAGGIPGEIIAFFDGRREHEAPRIGDLVGIGATLTGSALATALCAPAVFAVVRRIDSFGARRRDAEGTPSA